MADTKRIDYCITGTKGLFALIVLFRHYANGFFPALHTGNAADAKLPIFHTSIEAIINRTPLYFIVNGSFAVFVFWTLSGYLLSRNYYFYESVPVEEMRKKALKRYLVIVFPIFITYLTVCLMMRTGVFYNQQASIINGSKWLGGFYQFSPAFLHFLRSLLIDTFFTANVPYNPVLWTIEIETKGTFMLAMFLHLFGRMKKRRELALIMIIVILYTARLQYLCFVFGMLLGEREPAERKLEPIWCVALLVVCLFGGGGVSIRLCTNWDL